MHLSSKQMRKKIELEGRLEAVSEKIDTYSKLRKSRNKLDE